MSKHSAGPWSASDWTNAAIPEIAIHSADGQWLADVVVDQDFGDSADDCNQVANARMMVAAPELLEALKFAHERLMVLLDADEATVADQECLLEIEAAIAKATGEK